MKHLAAALILGLILTAHLATAQSAQTWNSRLLPEANGSFSPQAVNFAARNWSLDDFSYVGYFLGSKSLGSVPCNAVNVTATGDITVAVQAAINAVGQAGSGIVRIPAGTFVMSSSVAVTYNNVSIEGAGSGQTIINVPATYTSPDDAYDGDGLFTFGRTLGSTALNDGWAYKGSLLTNAAAVIRRGDMKVTTASASKINIGDWIVIQQFFWQALVNNNSSTPNQWLVNSSSEFSFTYLRQVTAKSGNLVSVDAPIPWTLDPANNPVNIRATYGQMKENSGVKGLTIRFANNTLASTGRPHGSAVYFEGVRNGWVYDVQVFNFPRNGIYVAYSARITILDSWVQTAQDTGGDGYGYGFLVSPAQNILIKRCHGEAARHNFISSHPQTSMIVQTQNVSVNATQPDDTHFGFEQGILWDDHFQIGGEALEELNRGDESSGAYETLAWGVIWNFYGDGVNLPGFFGGGLFLKPSPDGELIVVGVTGAHTVYDNSQGTVSAKGQQMLASPDLQVGTEPGALQNVLYEGLYQSGLQPASLYEAQLAQRLGTPPADWVEACGTPSAGLSVTSASAGGFSPGQGGAAYAVTVSNSSSGAATTGAVTVVETVPGGLTLVSMSGAGWTCSGNTCSRSDVLNPGSSYPPITVTVNVASNVASTVTNTVTVSGGGSAMASAIDPATIGPADSHPPFFSGEVPLSGGVYYLQFPDNNLFGYYNYVATSILYHYDMGYEAFIAGSASGVYLYDFASSHWWYTSSILFPYLYDFTLNNWLYYFPDIKNPGHYTTSPRYFSNLTTGKITTM